MLGPLVVAGAAIQKEQEESLWDQGVRDSKALPRSRRKTILQSAWEAGLRGWVVVIPPSLIDRENLTELELQAMASLIRRFRAEKAVVDAPVGPRAIPAFVAALSARSGLPPSAIEAFPKADAKRAIVAGASLLAKVVRDGYVQVLHAHFGDFGWGYPGETKVQEFLRAWWREYHELPEICRKRWRSVQVFLQPQLREAL